MSSPVFSNLSFEFLAHRGNEFSAEGEVIFPEGNSHSAIPEGKSASDFQKSVENVRDKPKTQVSNCWQYERLSFRDPLYNSARIVYPIMKDSGLELSFTQGACGLRGGVAVRCGEIPCFEGREDKALMTFESDGIRTNLLPTRMEGGQMLLLPEATTDTLLNLLLSEKTVVIYLNGYEARIPPENFVWAWEKLSNLKVCHAIGS